MDDLTIKFKKEIPNILIELKKFKNFCSTHPKFSIGDIITFKGGYYNNLLYKTQILGFDSDGDIYILWDCFWFPIADNEKRQIKLISKKLENAD